MFLSKVRLHDGGITINLLLLVTGLYYTAAISTKHIIIRPLEVQLLSGKGMLSICEFFKLFLVFGLLVYFSGDGVYKLHT